MSSAKSESLTSWLIWMPFISLCCLIAEAKTSNTMLNNSGEKYHIYFIHSSIDGGLGSFHNLAIVDNAAVNIEVHVPP